VRKSRGEQIDDQICGDERGHGGGQAGEGEDEDEGSGSGRMGERASVESTGEDDAPLMKESIDFFDFWDCVPERERTPPDKDDWVRVP